AIGAGSVKSKGSVGLDEMIMTSDLDRPIAEVGHRKWSRPASFVEDDFAWGSVNGAGNRFGRRRCDFFIEGRRIGNREEAAVKGEVQIAIFACDRVVNRDELGAVGKRALDLHLVDHF